MSPHGNESRPTIGTGVGGLPLVACAEAMIGAVVEQLRATRCIEEVRFCLFDTAALKAFAQVPRERFPEG